MYNSDIGPMSDKEYVEMDGKVCPVCGSKNLEDDSAVYPEDPDRVKAINKSCVECGSYWQELQVDGQVDRYGSLKAMTAEMEMAF